MLPQRDRYQAVEEGNDRIPLFGVGLDRFLSVRIVLPVLCLLIVSQEVRSRLLQRLASEAIPDGYRVDKRPYSS
jgi:hypothetical protein